MRKTVLSYGWYVATRLFYLAVIYYVFDHLYERFEKIVVAILGVLYVSQRTIAVSQGDLFTRVGIELDNIQEKVKEIAEPGYYRRTAETSEIMKMVSTQQTKLAVESVFLGIVSLLCLYELFVAI
jgi:hypothetical protein